VGCQCFFAAAITLCSEGEKKRERQHGRMEKDHELFNELLETAGHNP
jgi:hypothetical protein